MRPASDRVALSCAVLAITAATTVSPSFTGLAVAAATCTSSVPFISGTEGYNTFRIPAIIRTRRGTLIAFAEGRVNSSGDSGNIDLVEKRSRDGGCTWGPLQVVDDNGTDTIGNPAPVVDPRTGHIVLLSTTNGGTVTEAQIEAGQVTPDQSRRVFVQTSRDDGASWSTRRELTAAVKRADWRWYSTGPGHAIVVRHGRHAGRLIDSCDHTTAATPTATSSVVGAHDIYSDDGGRTWHIGFSSDNPADSNVHANETTAAELPDGRLYFNSRNGSGPTGAKRVDAYSDDGGRTLARAFELQTSITGPAVEGSVLQLPGGPLLYSGPANNTSRAQMTIRASTDGGANWTARYQVSTQFAAYSDLVQLRNRDVGLLYETGASTSHDTIAFTRIPVSALGGAK